MFSLNKGLLLYLFEGQTVDWHYFLTYALFAVAVIISSYLLGSINSAIVISRAIYHDDIRNHGSGNAGMTNMLRTYGGKAALLTLFGDLMKTVLAIVIAGVLFGFNYVAGVSLGDGYCYVAGLFAVLGHNWPIYYKFKGGKGVLATASMALILSPLPFLIVFAIFVLIVWASRYVSLGSVTAAMLYPVAFVGYIKFKFPGAQMPGLISLSLIILAILIVFRHLGNLQRIGDRTERKLSFGKKKDKEDDE